MKCMVLSRLMSVGLCVLTTSLPATAQPVLYWTDPGAFTIERANADGSNHEVLIAPADGIDSAPGSMALDETGGKLYWTGGSGTAAKIQRADLDGTNIETVLQTPASDLALDPGGGKMYWVTAFPDQVHRADLDGANPEILVELGSSNATSPRRLALDLNNGKMYWTTQNKLQRANLDGSDVVDLVNVEEGHGVALDIAGGKVYWGQRGFVGDAKIRRANLDGSEPEDLVDQTSVPELDFPIGIALDIGSGKMYWADVVAAKIQRANIDGSGVEDVITSGLRLVGAIRLGQTVATAIEDEIADLPANGFLHPNYPNPFGAATTIAYTTRQAGSVSLMVYDLLGREVRTLHQGFRAAGTHAATFEAGALPSGVYLYRLLVGDRATPMKRMVRLR